MAAEVVDTLELQISSSASRAAREVESLAASVADFGKITAANIGALEKLSTVLSNIADAARSLEGIKGIKNIISGAGSAAAKVKQEAFKTAKPWQPIIPPKRVADTVRGRTTLANMKGGKTIRFNASADAVARDMSSGYATSVSQRDISAAVQEARNMLINGNIEQAEAIIKDMAESIASFAGLKKGWERRGDESLDSLKAVLNTRFAGGIYVPDGKNGIGSYSSLAQANEALERAGVIARLYASEGTGSRTRSGWDDLFAGGYYREQGLGWLERYQHLEDVIDAVTHMSADPHRDFLNDNHIMDDETLTNEVFSDLWNQAFGFNVVENPKEAAAKAKEAAAEAARVAAEKKAEQLKIDKETETAWKDFAKWEREQDKRYREDVPQKINWKEVERNQERYEAQLAGPDRTAEEIAGWKEMEAANDHLSEMKRVAESIVGENTVGGVKSAEESMGVFIQAENEIRDILNRTSAALQKAIAPAAGMEKAAASVGHTLKYYNPATGNFDRVLDSSIGTGGADEKLDEIKKKAAEARENVAGLLDSLNNPPGTKDYGAFLDRFMGINAKPKSAEESMGVFMREMQGESEIAQTVRDLNPDLAQLSMQSAEASDGVSRMRTAFDALKDTASGSWLGKTTGQLMRVAKMRALRYVVKAFASGVKEGINNMYQWSKAVGGTFSSSMDTISTKFTLAKNSLATAFAPALNALVPVISTVVSWVNTASNAIAQLMALLSGQSTWVAATESVTEWGDATKSAAGGGSSAMKDLLADWDELNIIQSESGGGGGGGGGNAAADYANMFKEMDQFDEWTRYFDEIKAAVIAIGAGIAGWFVLGEIEQFLGKIGIAGATVEGIFSRIRKGIAGAVLLTLSFSLASAAGKDIARNGMTVTNVLESIGSLAAGAFGGYLFGSAIGGPVGGVIGAIAGLSIDIIIGVNAYFEQKNENIREKAKEILFDEVFEYDVDAKLNVVSTTIESVGAARDQLRADVSDMLGTINAIRLGISDEDTETTLRSQIESVVSSANSLASETKNFLQLRYQMVPALDESGNDISSSEYLRKSAEWDSVASWFEAKGKELGDLIVTNEKGQIEFSNDELAQALIDQINKATAAVTKAQLEAEASVDLNLALAKGADKEIPKLLEEYKSKITESAENMYAQEIQTQQALVAFYRETGNEKYEAANQELARMLTSDYRDAFIDEFVSGMTEGAMDRVREYYLDKYGRMNMFDMGDDWKERLAGYTPEQIIHAQEAWETRMSGDYWAGIPDVVRDFMQNKLGITEFGDLLTDDQKEYLATLKEMADTFKAGGYVEMDESDGEFLFVEDLYDEVSDFINNQSTPGSGANEPLLIDPVGSGMALDSTVAGMSTDIEGSIDEGTSILDRAIGSMTNEIVRAINGLDLTVNLTPSSALGQTMRRSAKSFSVLSGVMETES